MGINRYKVASNGRRVVSIVDGVITVQNARALDVADIITFTDGDTTPSVGDGEVFQTANTAACSITDFDDTLGNGHKITVAAGDALTKIVHNVTKISLDGSVDWDMVEGEVLVALSIDGVWFAWEKKEV